MHLVNADRQYMWFWPAVRSPLALTHLSCLMCFCQAGQAFMKSSYWGKSIQLHRPFTLNKLICLHKTARHRGASGACYRGCSPVPGALRAMWT
ncbi:hypothetical protein QQF64_031328 [Cirrhinus molitorella]|uniref:Secreted protein n=1 Tax=Cirrhinus molitorella TaxID=172907 RepID=A0ABR3MWQ2_9TELE